LYRCTEQNVARNCTDVLSTEYPRPVLKLRRDKFTPEERYFLFHEAELQIPPAQTSSIFHTKLLIRISVPIAKYT